MIRVHQLLQAKVDLKSIKQSGVLLIIKNSIKKVHKLPVNKWVMKREI